jgi:integrase
MQPFAWIKFLIQVKNSLASKTNLTKFSEYLFLFVAAAFSIKLVLQLSSTIPMVSTLAFGFRPIVIAYLHLVLLAVISVFLLNYIYSFQLINNTKLTIIGLTLFAIGVFLNELVLAVQGIASFSYIPILMANETLFFVSLLLVVSSILLVFSQRKAFTKNKLTQKEIQEMQDFVMLSLLGGIYIPPRRLKDYVDFRLRPIGTEEPTTVNTRSKNKLIFNSYKTAKTYGQQIVKMPPKLSDILNKWTNTNPTFYLFIDTKGKPLTNVKMNQRLNKIFGKKVSVNQLRHSYLTGKYGNLISQKNELKEDNTATGFLPLGIVGPLLWGVGSLGVHCCA